MKKAINGFSYFTFDIFKNQPIHSLFTTRLGGVSTGCYDSLNFGFPSGDDPECVRQNYALLAECLGTDCSHLVTSAQTHTNNVLVVDAAHAGMGITRPKDFTDIDALVTATPGLGIITAHADCTPVQFYDPVHHVIAAAHSGWMGTLKNISSEVIAAMTSRFDTNPADLLVAIGPALCQDCFEVDTDVAMRFFAANEDYRAFSYQRSVPSTQTGSITKHYIDLKKIICSQLTAAGVPADNIEVSNLCTKCHPELFYSHRNMGVKRGVMASAMILL
ncbi:MAG: peptidoglycan editing factor PgeF [Lachnospiraceae bacterium]|nr:peptidoglycan editing factor PgeF [Lachnospiraceae bacterium]